MLPCNVTVEEFEGGTKVNLINPKAMLLSNSLIAENEALIEIASDAYQRIERVAEALREKA